MNSRKNKKEEQQLSVDLFTKKYGKRSQTDE